MRSRSRSRGGTRLQRFAGRSASAGDRPCEDQHRSVGRRYRVKGGRQSDATTSMHPGIQSLSRRDYADTRANTLGINWGTADSSDENVVVYWKPAVVDSVVFLSTWSSASSRPAQNLPFPALNRLWMRTHRLSTPDRGFPVDAGPDEAVGSRSVWAGGQRIRPVSAPSRQPFGFLVAFWWLYRTLDGVDPVKRGSRHRNSLGGDHDGCSERNGHPRPCGAP